MPARKVLEQRIAALDERIGQLQASIAKEPSSDARTEWEETLGVLCQIHRSYVMRLEQIRRQDSEAQH